MPDPLAPIAHLNTTSVVMLAGGADRGDYTMPAEIAEAWAEVLRLADSTPPDFGAKRSQTAFADWRNERDTAMVKVAEQAVRYVHGNAGALISQYLAPALDTQVKEFTEAVAACGRFALEPDPTMELLDQSPEVRDAYHHITLAVSVYATIRIAWRALRSIDLGPADTDPRGVHSPLAEVRNIPQLDPNWQTSITSSERFGAMDRRPVSPFPAGPPHVRLAAMIRAGAELWLPNAAEQAEAWQAIRSELQPGEVSQARVMA